MSIADARDGAAVAPPPTGRFVLFDHAPPPPGAATASLYEVFERLRRAVARGKPAWARHPTLQTYAEVIFWSIRRLEYGFAAETVAAIEAAAGRPLRVLDLGCGVVPLGHWLAARGHAVVGLDPIVDEVALVAGPGPAKLYGSRVGYVAGQGQALPFPDAAFDLVLCISVLEHMPQGSDHLTLLECGRVLRPGGHLILTFDVAPARAGPVGLPLGGHRGPDSAFVPGQAESLLQTAGAAFRVAPDALPAKLAGLRWRDVHGFWQRQQQADGRAEPTRDYLAVGGVLERRRDGRGATEAEGRRRLLQAQEALAEHLAAARAEAAARLRVIEELDRNRANLAATEAELRKREEALQTQLETQRRLIAEHQEGLLARLEALTLRLEQLEQRQAAQWPRIERLLDGGPVVRLLRRAARPVRAARGAVRTRLGVLYQHPPQALLPPPYEAATPLPAERPLVSIVTPSFRQAAFIERTVNSVLGQTYPAIEYVVQDGGSDDGTVDILRRYAGRLAAWESAPDRGQTDAINKAFAKTTGEIMAWLNSDDMLLPATVAYVVGYFQRHPEVDMVYGHRIVVDEQDREIGLWILPPHSARALRLADYVPQETLFWRRRVWDRIGPLDESFHFAMDWDFLLRAQAAGFRIVRLPRFLACFRAHERQKTATEIDERGAEEMRRLRVRSFGREPSRAEVRLKLRPYLLHHVLLHLGYRLGLVRY